MKIRTRIIWYTGLALIAAGIIRLRIPALTTAYLSTLAYYVIFFPIWTVIGRYAGWTRIIRKRMMGLNSYVVLLVAAIFWTTLAIYFTIMENTILISCCVMLALYSADEFFDLRDRNNNHH